MSLFQPIKLQPNSCSMCFFNSPRRPRNIHISSTNSTKPNQQASPATLQVLAQIFKTTPSPDTVTYTAHIELLGQSGRAAEASELFAIMREHHRPDTVLFTVVIRILCDSYMFGEAIGLLYLMRYYNCGPDVICYNTLIDKLGEAGREKLVRKLRVRMEEERVCADVVTYSSVVKSHCVGNNIGEALSVLRLMEMSRSVRPNTYTYNTIIKAYLDRGRAKEALGVLGRMEIRGCRPDLCSYNLFIKYYSDLGRGVEGYMFLEKMVVRGIEASQSSYTICLYGLMKDRKVDMVLDVIEEMNLCSFAISVCTWNNLIMWLGKIGRVDEAYSALLRVGNPDEITINIVIQLLYNHGRGENAWEVFGLAKERRITVSTRTYNILINGMCKEGNDSKAFELAERMEDEICAPADVVTYNCLLNSLCNRREIEDACRLVLKMLTKGCKPDLITINTLIKGMIRVGRTGDASRLFEHMKGKIAANSVTLKKLVEEITLYQSTQVS